MSHVTKMQKSRDITWSLKPFIYSVGEYYNNSKVKKLKPIKLILSPHNYAVIKNIREYRAQTI